MGRRGTTRYLNRLRIAALSEAADPAHDSRCRIVHAERASAFVRLTGHTFSRQFCDAFLLGKCRNADCRDLHAVYNHYGYDEFDPPRWADDHARLMNRVLWNELWVMEHKLGFLQGQLNKLANRREVDGRERKRARRARRRELDTTIAAARLAREEQKM